MMLYFVYDITSSLFVSSVDLTWVKIFIITFVFKFSLCRDITEDKISCKDQAGDIVRRH